MPRFTKIITVICLLSTTKALEVPPLQAGKKSMQECLLSSHTAPHTLLINMSSLAQRAILRAPL